MADTVKKRKVKIFPMVLAVYAIVFLLAAGFGLRSFWNYLTAYEASRPENTLNAYMQSLSPQSVCDASSALLDQVDTQVQSREQYAAAMLQALSGEFQYMKDSKQSSQSKLVYALLCDQQVIGSFEMEQTESLGYGFSSWEITKESFDLSYLLTDTVTLTVPQQFSVYVNGNLLEEDKITQSNIPYGLLKECYDSYTLPYLVQYSAGPFIGEPDIEIRDGSCEPVLIDEATDFDQFLPHCTEEKSQQLHAAATAFLHKYIDYTCNTGKDPTGNLAALRPYLYSGSSLQKRMQQALDGLNWVPDRGATLVSMEIHNCIDIGNDRFLCDMTYVVNTTRHSGEPQSTTDCKIVFVYTGSGFQAETMLNY